MDNSRLNKSRFTLIELLAVVALISMLMAVGVPAFARMIRGSRVDESARNIKLALEQAQMRAASERCYVAVIFPNGFPSDQSSESTDPDSPDSTALMPYRLGGFRTAYVRESSGSYTFIRWVEGSDWSNAPDGAALIKVTTAKADVTPNSQGYVTGCVEKANGAFAGGALTGVDNVKNDSGNTTLTVGDHCAIIFSPYGSVVGSSKLYLLVYEARIEGTAVTYPSAQSSGSNSTANYQVLQVNNLTGRVEFLKK